MSPLEHYRQAEGLIASAQQYPYGDPAAMQFIAEAHVHALLAGLPQPAGYRVVQHPTQPLSGEVSR